MQVRPWPPKYYAHYAEISKQCKIRSLSKVVVTFYLRWRNEFQPFTAKNQRSNGWVNQRPGVWWEMAGIHFSISDKRFFFYTSKFATFWNAKTPCPSYVNIKTGEIIIYFSILFTSMFLWYWKFWCALFFSYL